MNVIASARALLLLTLLAPLAAGPRLVNAQDTDTETTGSLEASGLTNPRGFTWGADGTLYVALAGTGVPNADTDGAASAVPAAGAPGSDSAGVARIDNGCADMIVAGLSSGGLPELGWVFGVADLAILDGQLYALVDGGGEVWGHPDQPNGIYRVQEDGTATLVADLSAWFRANPVAAPHEPINPEGLPYGMVVIDGRFWVIEANHEQLLAISPDGEITRLADLSLHGNVAPDAITAAPAGGVYVGFLSALPFTEGTAKVVHISPEGVVSDVWTGLSAVTGVAVDADGQLYALEMATGSGTEPPFVAPGTGRLVRQTGPNSAAVVAEGMDFPVKLKIAPNGDFLIAAPAFGANDGEGTILRLTLGDGDSPAFDVATISAGGCDEAGKIIRPGMGPKRT